MATSSTISTIFRGDHMTRRGVKGGPTGLIRLDPTIRRDLLIYTLKEVGEIESYSKLALVVMALSNKLEQHGIYLGYEFDRMFLRVSDEDLENDLLQLYFDEMIENDERAAQLASKKPGKLSETHRIKVSGPGEEFLRTFDIEEVLKLRIGQKIALEEITRQVKHLSKLSIPHLEKKLNSRFRGTSISDERRETLRKIISAE